MVYVAILSSLHGGKFQVSHTYQSEAKLLRECGLISERILRIVSAPTKEELNQAIKAAMSELRG